MTFQKGQSGNPSGRPPGTRNRRTIAAEKLFDEDAEALTRIAIDLAKEGDMAALRLCMDRVCPPTRHRPVSFELPQLAVAQDAVGAMSTIVQAIADGELSPPRGGRARQGGCMSPSANRRRPLQIPCICLDQQGSKFMAIPLISGPAWHPTIASS